MEPVRRAEESVDPGSVTTTPLSMKGSALTSAVDVSTRTEANTAISAQPERPISEIHPSLLQERLLRLRRDCGDTGPGPKMHVNHVECDGRGIRDIDYRGEREFSAGVNGDRTSDTLSRETPQQMKADLAKALSELTELKTTLASSEA